MDSAIVLKQCGIAMPDKQTLSVPHLSDKMIVDLINGLEVSKDHIKVSKATTSKFKRLTGAISGKSKLRQDLINENLANGLESASVWLQKHDYELSSVNMAISKVSEKLLETRQGVMKLAGKHQRLAESVNALAETVQQKSSQLYEYIRDVDHRTRAEKQLDRVFASWGAGRLQHLEFYPRIFTVLDNLRSNDFGFYLSMGNANAIYKKEMVNHLKDKLICQTCEEFNIKANALTKKGYRMKITDMEADLNQLTPELLSSLNYLSDWSQKEQHEHTWLFHQLSDAVIDKTKMLGQNDLPSSIRVDNWLDEMSDESFSTQG